MEGIGWFKGILIGTCHGLDVSAGNSELWLRNIKGQRHRRISCTKQATGGIVPVARLVCEMYIKIYCPELLRSLLPCAF